MGKGTARDGIAFLGVTELGGCEDNTFEDFALLTLDIVHEVALCHRVSVQQVLGYMVEHVYVPTAQQRAVEQEEYDRAYEREPVLAAS